jgi:membrane protease YdiL (CAAX protease family)
MEKSQTKKVTLWYLLITFLIMGITWGGIYIAQQYGYLKSGSMLFFPLYIFGGASATIASFGVLTKSGVPVKNWLKNVFGVKQKPFFYLIVLLFLLCYTVVGFITRSLTVSMPIVYLLLFSLTGIVEGGLEEAGWRYVLQPNFEKVMPFSLATLLTGTIWVLWHLPLFFIDGTVQKNMNFGLFFIFFIAYSFSLAVIRKLTKSVWLCVLFHSTLNAVLTVFAIKLRLIETIIMSSVMIIVSLLLLKVIERRSH